MTKLQKGRLIFPKCFDQLIFSTIIWLLENYKTDNLVRSFVRANLNLSFSPPNTKTSC